MNDFRNIFTVSRAEYKNFVLEIKPETRRVEIVDLTSYSQATKIFSQKTGKCLCSRVTYIPATEGEETKPEEYYIFEMPDDDERLALVPRMKVVLDTKEEVQAFLNGIAEMRKENKDD